jgi:sugar fermentation stimulation protein A
LTPSVDLPPELVEARFVERPNRFVLRCRLRPGADPEDVHLADPGRLKELLLPDARVLLRPADRPERRTRWSAVLVETPEGDALVSVDTTLPNRLVDRALRAGALEELAGWRLERREWAHGASRFDFLLAPAPDGDRSEDARLVLEVKSVTLLEGDVARFPDAVTARGARHLTELAELARRPGWEAAVLFVCQRPGARRIEAARSIDPVFADALQDAARAGVRVLGRRCVVTRQRVSLADPVPTDVGP